MPRPEMPQLSDDVVLALALAAGIEVTPTQLAGVKLNLERLLAQGRLVMAVSITVADEPAPTFAP